MTYAESIEYENREHRRYFEPFDNLLERKAQYYLDKTESTGQPYKMLLEEIETLERFREYAARMQTIMQEGLTIQYRLALYVEHWKMQWHKELEHGAQQNYVLGKALDIIEIQGDKLKSFNQ